MKKEIIGNFSFVKYLIFKYKKIFIFIIGLLVAGFLLAFLFPDDIKQQVFNDLLEKFSKFSNQNEKLFYQIFLNNLIASFTELVLGFLLIVPLIGAFYNGFIFGIVVDFTFSLPSSANFFEKLFLLSAGILPHGIIEIPMLIISVFLSFLLGLKIYFTEKIEPKMTRKQFLLKIIKIFIFVIVPLILIAALIESFVTDKVINITITNLHIEKTIDIFKK